MGIQEGPPGDSGSAAAFDAFVDAATELADGERWKLVRAEGWDDFIERLAVVAGELPVRRRQALMMLLVSLVEELVRPEQVNDFIRGHDLDSEGGIEALIAWLRSRRSEISREGG